MGKKQTETIILEQRFGKFPFPKAIEERDDKDPSRISAGLRDLLGNGETISTRVSAS